MMNIVFVCTGNTCRSPLAEGLMKKLLTDRGINTFNVTSAGLAAYPGDEVSEKSVIAAQKYGVDISSHRARRISEYMLSDSVFVCMTASHAQALIPYLEENRLFVLGGGVADPYGGTQEIYDLCARQISDALPDLLAQIIKSNTSITAMDENHISQIARIEEECFSLPWSETSLRQELENENAHFLTALIGEDVAGYIGVIEICGEADITNVAVDTRFRRFGIGEKLLKSAEEGAIERGCESITLEVRISNEAAISLYEKSGYEKVGIRKGFYEKPTEDALLMTEYFSKDN
jgi:ribosomal-protein-alanine N-acetyltransferase